MEIHDPIKTTTPGQIDKAVAAYRAMLEKHAPQFAAEFFQKVLGQPELAKDQFNLLRAHVEVVSNLIVHHVRRVKVNRTRTPEQAVAATGRALYVSSKVVATMPRGIGDEVEVVFFKVGRYLSNDGLGKEYELRGLIPADPYSVAAVNEADPAFADEHPNATHWKNVDGKYCCAVFDRWDEGRVVRVDQYGVDWYGDWWFAGFRK